MHIQTVYNEEEMIRLVNDSLKKLLGERISRISFEIGLNNKIIVVTGEKKWLIKVEEYKEK